MTIDDLIAKNVGVIKGTRDLKIAEGKTDYELLEKINNGLYTIMNNELIDKHLRWKMFEKKTVLL